MDQNIDNQQPEVIAPLEQQPNPVAPQDAAVKSNRANIIIVISLLILILLALGGIVWIYTKSPSKQTIKNDTSTQSSSSANETAPIAEMKGWQTFNDKRIDFTFQYPQGWTATVEGTADFPDVIITPQGANYYSNIVQQEGNSNQDYKTPDPKYIRIQQRKGDYSSKSFANFKANNDAEFNSQFYKDRNITISYEDTTLGGKQALILRTTELPGYREIVVFINGAEYDFEVGVGNEAELNGILKTVKFSN